MSTGELMRLVLMAVAVLASWLGLWRLFLQLDLIAILATLFGGYPIYKETLQALRRKQVNMEVSMTLGIFASMAIQQYTVAAVIALFVLVAERIEEYAVNKGRATIYKLEESMPKKALVRRDGNEIETEVRTLALGDTVIVREGERLSVDGTVVRGSAVVDQSAITGEAIPSEKNVGAYVYAGSVNKSGLIEVQVQKTGVDTVFGELIKLVEEAEGKKAPIQRVSDRLSAWLVEFAIIFSVFTFIVTRNLISTISVIVVAGACGVAAGTPLAIVATMSNAAKRGVVVKGGVFIEEMNRIDTVVIDKTGTLTLGDPVVTGVVQVRTLPDNTVIQYAATAERHSNHPIARAIVKSALALGLTLDEHSNFKYLPGKGIVATSNGHEIVVGNNILMAEKGVELTKEIAESVSTETANGKTIVLVANQNKICGFITISDRIRSESKKAIEELRKMGIRTIMLTGDNRFAAEAVAKEVGIDEVQAELLPQDKVTFVKRLVSEGHKVAMVGDGINDAPALAHADVGIGLGSGTDIAIEEADIVLMTSDLQKISYLLRSSRKAYRTIMQNFGGTLIVDGIGVALAFVGLLNPFLAAGIHVGSELIFISNSAKLIR
jgi:Cd2+/Zn2+-exporting ATPase/Cu+-exporting ATPase